MLCRRWARIVMVIVLLFMVPLGWWSWSTIDYERRYQQAQAAYQQGDYALAYRGFEELGYYDSGGPSRIRDDRRYHVGLAAVQQKEWMVARQVLSPIWQKDGVARLLDQIAIQLNDQRQPVIGSVAVSDQEILDLAMSREGGLITTISRDGTVSVWNGQELTRLVLPIGLYPDMIAFSPDGELIALAGSRVPIQVWRWRDSRLIWERKPATFPVLDLLFSPDGQWLHVLSMKEDKPQLDRWDTRDGKFAENMPINNLYVAPSVGAISRDGRLAIFYGANRIIVYSLVSEKVEADIACHGCVVRRMTFGPDGETVLMSLYHDLSLYPDTKRYRYTTSNSVELWEVRDVGSYYRFGPRYRVSHDVDQRGVGVNSNGSTVVTGTDSGMLLFWKVVQQR